MARAGGADLNPANYSSRAAAFSSAAGLLGDVTLLVHRTTAGITGHLITADRAGCEPAAMHLAQAVAARAEPVDAIPDLSATRTVGWLKYRPGSAVNRETQSGVDPSEAARRLAVALAPGQWVAVSMRQPTQGEKRRHRRWLVARMATANPTHHSVTTGAVVVAVRAGADSAAEVSSLLVQVASAMPGFDVDTVARVAHPVRAVLSWVAAGLAVWLGLWQGFDLQQVGTLAGSGLAGIGALLALGVLPAPGARLAEEVASGRIHAPTRRIIPPRRPRKHKQENGETVQTQGDYPLTSDGFMVAPNVVVGLVAPGAGALSGASTTSERATPPTMRAPIGALVGTGTDGASVFFSAPDSWSGTFLVGRAGSGKMEPLTARFPTPVSSKFPDGWAANAELEVGDEVYAPDGSATKIRGFSPVQTVDTYGLSLSDGQVVAAGPEHLWRVSTRYSRTCEQTGTATADIVRSRHADLVDQAAHYTDLAATVPPGMNATVADIARLVGVAHSALKVFLDEAGLDHVRQAIELRPAGKKNNSSTVVYYPADAAVTELRRIAAGPRSVLTSQQIDEVAALGGAWLTADAIERALMGREPTKNGTEVVRARLADLAGKRREQVARIVESNADVRSMETYPVAEVLHAWAQRILDNGPAPVERLVSTAEMSATALTEAGHTNFAIRTSAPIQAAETDLPVDPYLLGCWLGDGASDAGSVVVGREDIEFFRTELSSAGFSITEKIRPNEHGPVYYLSFGRPDPGACKRGHQRVGPRGCTVCDSGPHRRSPHPKTNVSFGEHLIDLGIRGAKRAPAIFLRASVGQRLALLQGLMDTDGTISATGSCELSLSDPDLANDALELVRSLGIKASVSRGRPSGYRDEEGALVVCKDRHRIKFTTELPVFRMPRKAERVPTQTRATQRWLYVTGVTQTAPQPMRCITVEHPSGMYLTGGFVPTHNSQLVRSLFGWNCMERVTPCGLPGFPGAANTLVAFESKGDGAEFYSRWAATTGDRTLLVDVAEPSSVGIDLFAVPGTVADRAGFFANAMVYAFEPGSIQDRSFATLVQVFTAALSITPEVASLAKGVDPAGSPVYFAHVLLAGQGDEMGASLAGAVMSEAVRLDGAKTPNAELSLARTALLPLFGGKSEAARRVFLEAPSNKVAQLLALDHWWTGARPKTTWHQILTEHRSVVVNTGVTTTGRIVDDRLSAQMSSLLMFGLRDGIMRYCNGWSGQGRSVSIFADELSLLAGSSPEVVTWLRNQGRSYGVRPVLATQYPEQLSEQVRMAVTGFSTIVAFAQDNVRVADELSRDFAADGTPWQAADVVNLPPFTTIVRSSVGQQRQSAFTMSVINFEADLPGFVAAQRAAAGLGAGTR
jgi:hypothetical protein